MLRRVSKLLILLSVLLMPMGMAAAPAAAPHHGPVTSAAQVGHCADQQSPKPAAGGVAECMMACAAALPALDSPGKAPLTILCAPPSHAKGERLHGLHPDTATPPPKRS